MNNMKRMVWVAVAMLIMIAIMGFGLHSLNRITEVNQERREKDKGEAFVAKILETTATTSVWDKLRAKEDERKAEELAKSTDVDGNQIPVQTDEYGNPIVQNFDNQSQNDEYQNPEELPQAEPDDPEGQFTTSAVPVIIE